MGLEEVEAAQEVTKMTSKMLTKEKIGMVLPKLGVMTLKIVNTVDNKIILVHILSKIKLLKYYSIKDM